MSVHLKHSLMLNEEIDHIIDGICQEHGSLSDAFDFPEEPESNETPNERDEFPEDESDLPPDSGIGGTFRPGGGLGRFVNMYPANARGACRPHFLVVFPADPLRKHRKVTAHERQRRTILYFQNALRAMHRWAANCGGKDVILLTEQWAVAPGITESPLWANTLTTQGVQHQDWGITLRGLLRTLQRQAASNPALRELRDLVHDLEVHWDRGWWPHRHWRHWVETVNSAGIPSELRKQLLQGLRYKSHGLIDPAKTFHENLQAFREMHPDVNFHIRLAALPHQKPARFRFVGGEPWSRV